MTDEPLSFLARLKRHHIFKVASVYAIAAWVLIQLANSIFPDLGWPRQSVLILIVAVVLLFPVVLALAWMLIPPSKENPDKFTRWQRLHWRLGSVLTLVIVVLATISGAYLWHANTHHLKANTVAASIAPNPTPASGSTTSIPAKSIAVLPFENLSADKNNAYFADGMQDLILTKLADIGDLKVIARTSTAKYASHPDDLKTIARQLGVATILEGSVQKAGNQVLINVQLIDANTNAHLWAEAYTRTLDNIFGVEGEVAQKVADALNAKLTPVETQRVSAVPTQNPQAWNLFLQGEYYRNRCDVEYLESECDQAIQDFHAAIEQDPRFVLAYARLAMTQLFQTRLNAGDSSAGIYAAAKANIDRALALAPDLAEAHLAQGYYEDYANNNLDASLAAFEAARALKPQDAEILFAIGINHKHRGQWNAAIQSYRQALVLDPRNLTVLGELAHVYNLEGRYGDAARVVTQGLAINPESGTMLDYLVNATLLQTGDVDRTLAVLDAAPASVQNDASTIWMRAWLMYLRRDYAAARTLMARVPAGRDMPAWQIEELKGDIESAAGNKPAADELYRRAAAQLQANIKTAADSNAKAALHLELGWIYASLGRKREALEQVRLASNLIPAVENAAVEPYVLDHTAQIQARLGDAGEAVALLDRVLAESEDGDNISVPLLKIDPTWDPIRNDPRFQALLKKYGSTAPSPGPAAATQ